MYTTRKHRDCAHCGTADDICAVGRPLAGERGRCCAQCRRAGHPEQVERTITPDLEPAAGVPAAGPLSRAEEDAVVRRLLAAADDPVEQHGDVAVSAFQSLAASRGIPLEAVIRAACRQRLGDVVQQPAHATQQNTPSSTEEINHV